MKVSLNLLITARIKAPKNFVKVKRLRRWNSWKVWKMKEKPRNKEKSNNKKNIKKKTKNNSKKNNKNNNIKKCQLTKRAPASPGTWHTSWHSSTATCWSRRLRPSSSSAAATQTRAFVCWFSTVKRRSLSSSVNCCVRRNNKQTSLSFCFIFVRLKSFASTATTELLRNIWNSLVKV